MLYRSQSTFDRRETIGVRRRYAATPPNVVQRYLVGPHQIFPTAEPGHTVRAAPREREVAVLRLLRTAGTPQWRCSSTIAADKNIVHDIVSAAKLRNRTHAVAHALRAGLI